MLFWPVRLFQELRSEPRALGALIVGALLSALATALLPLELWEAGIREQLLAAGEDLPANLDTMARVTWVSTIFASVVVWPLFVLLTSSIFALVFLFGLGYEGSFRTTLSVSAHALVVVALGSLALLPVRILAEDASLSLTPAIFAPVLDEGLLLRYLELLDFFNLWAFLLVGVGAAVVDGKRSIRTGGAVGVGIALVLALFLAALMNAFGGGS